MLGFHPVSAAPFSATAKVTHTVASSLSAVATQTMTPSQLGAASLGTGSPFSLGFSLGFEQGISLIGNGTITQEFLGAVASLVADGTIEKLGLSSLAPSISISALSQMQISPPTSIQTVGSLVGNSVLLIGGTVNLVPLATIEGVLSSPLDNADQADFTLYLDKIREFSSYIDTTRGITSYIDKQKAITLYVDEILSPTSYIDKQRSFDLIREK